MVLVHSGGAGRLFRYAYRRDDVWAVSQADPFRRMHVKGALSICNSGASGGFISDSKIDGAITTGCAQQFYIRNSVVNGANAGGIWNFLFQGCDNPPAETFGRRAG